MEPLTEEIALRKAIVHYHEMFKAYQKVNKFNLALDALKMRDKLHELENACQLYGFFERKDCTE